MIEANKKLLVSDFYNYRIDRMHIHLLDRKSWRGGREAEGAGLLNRYTTLKSYRGFESLSLRHFKIQHK